MILNHGGALVALLFFGAPASAEVLTASLPDGTVILQHEIARDEGWCVIWNHSVKGFQVADCYVNLAGQMVLMRSHLPDFAAGLDHIPGRGIQVSDGQGGYWIEDLHEAVPANAYILRPGGPTVNHRLRIDGVDYSLTAMAEHERVRIALN